MEMVDSSDTAQSASAVEYTDCISVDNECPI